jgi:hypothetical protein
VEDQRSSVERLIARSIDEAGRPLSSRAREGRRSIEDYLKAGARPRWMERVMEVDQGIAGHRRRLERAHRDLRERWEGDREELARRWTAYARAYDFGELNELIRQHNEWYPIERDLPVNPRTGDYVTVSGRSFRRPRLDADWILERFPA